MKNVIFKSVLWGMGAGIVLLAIYFIVMGIGSGSLSYTFSELLKLKYWITALVVGFGTQVGLYVYLKSLIHLKAMQQGTVVTSATTSGVAMIACCAHHLTDILPLIGLSLVATVLVNYQVWFLAAGIGSNLIGIFLLVKQIRSFR